MTLTGASTTADEAARTRSLLWDRGVRRVLLVTDADHMARAAAVFTRVGFTVFAAPVNEPEWNLEPHSRVALLHRTLREAAAMAYYYTAGYL